MVCKSWKHSCRVYPEESGSYGQSIVRRMYTGLGGVQFGCEGAINTSRTGFPALDFGLVENNRIHCETWVGT